MRGRRRTHLFVALLIAAPVALQAEPPAYDGRRWELVFEDEFSGTALDESRWSYHYPWSRTHNHSAYSRSGNVAVRDGRLILTALEESFGGKPYTTGVVNTSGKFHTTYGYIEARLRMPSTKGSWPAFWMLQDGWPPEIDIMEFPLGDLSPEHNEKHRYWWNYHWGTVSDHRSAGSEEWQGADLSAGFHDYAVEWSPAAMRFFLDGSLRGTVTDRAAIAQSAGMYIILNYAVGGWPGEPTSWPAEGDRYEIDWVRAWRLEEPDLLIDLGDIVGGGTGNPLTASPHAGIHPDTGAFEDDLALNSVSPTGANPEPVPAPLIDSVFVLSGNSMAINTGGTRFSFPPGDAAATTWDLISNVIESDGPHGHLELGPKGVFTRGIGMHASSGVTFDLDEIRSARGDQPFGFFSAFAGEGSIQQGGSVRSHAILADAEGRVLHAVSTGPHTDDGRFIEMEIPAAAKYLTLASGCAGNGNAMDHGVFAGAALTPCSASDPALCLGPDDDVLSFSRSVWTYLDEGPAPPPAWKDPSFAAAGWKQGPAPLGFGEGDEGTEVLFGADPGRKRITTHFRRAFSLEDAAEVRELELWLLCDDGAAVYLNGQEVLRSNLPESPEAVDADTPATATVDGDAERRWQVAALDRCLLAEGRNVVAAEIHQASVTSSDLRFDLVVLARRSGAGEPAPCGAIPFRRGDCNGDDKLDLSDAVCILEWLFLGGEAPGCAAAGNSNGDARVDISDGVSILEHLFLGGPPPPPPYPECGSSALPEDAEIGCGVVPEGCG